MKVLSLNDEDAESIVESGARTPSIRSKQVSVAPSNTGKSSFFKSFKKSNANTIKVRDEAGMEGELVDRLGKLQFKTQVEEFYTAYSKVCLDFGRPRDIH